jgi:hypothetical protein
MRSGWWLAPVLIITLVLGGVAGAFIAGGHDDDRVVQITTPSGDEAGDTPQVVRVEDDGRWRGFGFFPFGLFLFPLLWIVLIWLIAGSFWRRGPGRRPWDDRFQDWHRRQHESDGQGRGESSAASS